ncbi:MAG: hypothetical protein WCG27_11830 [Pseudomonadota bacterium]
MIRYSTLSISLLLLSLFFPVGCGKFFTNFKIDGVQGPTFTQTNGFGVMSMTFDNVTVEGDPLHVDIPRLPNSSVELAANPNGGANLDVKISQTDITNILNEIAQGLGLQYMGLPDGRPLPGVETGMLPTLTFTIGNEKLQQFYVYLGQRFFGVFIPVKLNIGPTIATFRYYISKQRAGNISAVGGDANGNGSGILILFDGLTRPIQDWLNPQRFHSAETVKGATLLMKRP